LSPLIICDERDIRVNEYEVFIYNGLFSLIDDLLEPLDNSETIHIANESTFLFIQENAPCYKSWPCSWILIQKLYFHHEMASTITQSESSWKPLARLQSIVSQVIQPSLKEFGSPILIQ